MEDEYNAFESDRRRHYFELPGMMAVVVHFLIDEVVSKAVVIILKEPGYFLIVTNENSAQVNYYCY